MNRTIHAPRTLRALGAVLTLFVLAVLAVAIAHGSPTDGRPDARMPMSPGGAIGTGAHGDGAMHDSMHGMVHGSGDMSGMPGATHGMGGMHGMTGVAGGHHGMHGSHPMRGAGAGPGAGAEDGMPYSHDCAETDTDAAPR